MNPGDDNPYRSPDAELVVHPRTPRRPWRGVLAGVVTDWGMTFAGTILVAAMYGFLIGISGREPGHGEFVAEFADPTSAVGMANALVACVASLVAGWVCVRVARSTSLREGAILALVMLLWGLAAAAGALSSPWVVLQVWAGPLLNFLGAWLALKRRSW